MSGSFPLPPPGIGCDGFLARLHFRSELPPEERASFDRHAALCCACARVLLEAERVDDLLLEWRAPEPAAKDGDSPEFADRVLRVVRGEGPLAGCAETTASLHHFVAGDLEPWLAARVERHLARCRECADHLDEARHSRTVWLAWRAPDPKSGFADDLVRRLEPETRAARRRRQVLELVFGAVHVPRWAAALVLVSVSLLALGVLEMRGQMTRRDGRPRDFDLGASVGPSPRSVPVVPAQFVPAGRSDPTGSFSPDFRGGRNGLTSAMRGEGSEK
jgi:anti-sigma factor RsiW